MAALIPEITRVGFLSSAALTTSGSLLLDRGAGGEIWLTTSIPLTAEEFRALERELLDIAERATRKEGGEQWLR